MHKERPTAEIINNKVPKARKGQWVVLKVHQESSQKSTRRLGPTGTMTHIYQLINASGQHQSVLLAPDCSRQPPDMISSCSTNSTCISVFFFFSLWGARMRARSWERCGETGLVLLGFLTLAVSVGNLSTRGLQVRSSLLFYRSSDYPEVHLPSCPSSWSWFDDLQVNDVVRRCSNLNLGNIWMKPFVR